MRHLGDVTKINGAIAPVVDIVTFGAPCQDISVAGKRAGMKHEGHGDDETTRSGLFYESLRIIKEMRDECARQLQLRGSNESIRPRFAVYENVAGIFSSNKGEDFRCVLEETAKVVDQNAIIPGPPKGKWQNSGCVMGDGWSIAWRVHDAQYWGVPQRRRRVCVLADFNGYTAGKLVFDARVLGETEYSNAFKTESDIRKESEPEVQSVSESVSGNIEQSNQEGQTTASIIGENTETAGTISFQERAGKPGGGKGILIQHERTGALSTLNIQSVLEPRGSTTD